MKTKILILFILFSLLWSFPLNGDWKKEITGYYHKAREYEGIINYLESHLDSIPALEKGTAVIILCFSCKELGDSVGEAAWMARYFDKFETPEADFDFLGRKASITLYEYIESWNRRYPGLSYFHLHKDSRNLLYFKPPDSLTLVLQSRAPCVIEISSHNELLFSGYLKRGPNSIALPWNDSLAKQKYTPLQVLLKTGAVRLRKRLLLNASYLYPDDIAFEPIEGKIAIKGLSFKKEKSEKTITVSKRFFDKKYFKRKALPHLAVGVGLFALDRLAVHKAAGNPDNSPGSRAFMNGLDKSAAVMSLGLSLKGVYHIFRSFKKEKKTFVKSESLPENEAFNSALRLRLNHAKDHIRVHFTLSSANKKGEPKK
ncbi:MAG: hypothetical protein GY757_25635 [bacterium]|nr:hypothetical protein [bacterium]